MKSILKYVFFTVVAGLMFPACSDLLETSPTSSVSGSEIFPTAEKAETAIDGVYALLWRPTYVSGNTSQAFGHQSTLLALDLMADDVVQMTHNWFGFDYRLTYTATTVLDNASRSYSVWNMCYTLISNCNYILYYTQETGGDPDLLKSIIAQTYAMRAFCYFELIQGWQKTYLGHENDPGVPVYTEPTMPGGEGAPRGTVQQVYDLIVSDIEMAVSLFEEIDKPVQNHSSHVDYYVAKGFEARIALVQGRWEDAYNAAREARSRSGLRLLSGENELLSGLSDIGLPSSLWAMEMLPDQSQIWGSIYCFLDPQSSSSYGSLQRKCISSWLYNQINDYDIRKQWFLDGNQGDVITGVEVNYGQMKRLARSQANWEGDLLYMRGEEMLLIQAEAKARMSQYADARNLLKELMSNRATDDGLAAYGTYLDALSDGNTLSAAALANTNTTPRNILEEVILQRRIELWGEQGRLKDILRLKQAFDRDYDGSNHVELLKTVNTRAESGAFLFKIPQEELNGNINISSEEQNPIS